MCVCVRVCLYMRVKVAEDMLGDYLGGAHARTYAVFRVCMCMCVYVQNIVGGCVCLRWCVYLFVCLCACVPMVLLFIMEVYNSTHV